MARLETRVVQNARGRGVVVVRRGGWGSLLNPLYSLRRKVRKHSLLPKRPVDTVWQHISVTHDTGTTMASFKKDVRTLERIGWSRFKTGISYNFAIDATTGWVAVGMPLDAKGSHTQNDKKVSAPDGGKLSEDQNAVSIAIVVIGMPGAYLSDRAGDALINLLAALMEEGAVTRYFDYLPHSYVAYKDCPTENIREVMPGIKRKAVRRSL